MPPALKVKPEAYARLNLHELILVSIHLVAVGKETCTFERLVAECFHHFPKALAAKSNRTARPSTNCRKNTFIGSTKLFSAGNSSGGEKTLISVDMVNKNGINCLPR
jgi:hypothetical protein